MLLAVTLVNFCLIYLFSIDTSANTTMSGNCYQTMGYCDAWTINYSCVKRVTSERCRLYACEDCGLADKEKEINP